MAAYYNEIDPYCVAWLRNLIAAELIPAGDVDDRSITDIDPGELHGYTQHHFFAGLGGWSRAARIAGWPDDRPLVTGSPPCQPFSVAGRQRGTDDDRDLWPHYFALVRSLQPPVIVGEQVYAAVRHGWLDRAFDDLEGAGYACRALGVPACAVNAPHRRDRLWFVASDTTDGRRRVTVGHSVIARLEGLARDGDDRARRAQATGSASATGVGDVVGGNEGAGRRHDAWDGAGWIIGYDGKARRVPESALRGMADGSPANVAGLCPGHDAEEEAEAAVISLLAAGVPARIGKLRALGNAIVPQVAAVVLEALLECEAQGGSS